MHQKVSKIVSSLSSSTWSRIGRIWKGGDQRMRNKVRFLTASTTIDEDDEDEQNAKDDSDKYHPARERDEEWRWFIICFWVWPPLNGDVEPFKKPFSTRAELDRKQPLHACKHLLSRAHLVIPGWRWKRIQVLPIIARSLITNDRFEFVNKFVLCVSGHSREELALPYVWATTNSSTSH